MPKHNSKKQRWKKYSSFLAIKYDSLICFLPDVLVHIILMYADSTDDQNLKMTFGKWGSADGQFNYPNGVAMANNLIYVADTDNHRIQIADLDGKFITKIGDGNGSADGQFYSPFGIVVANNHIYVADTSNHRI